VGPTFWGFWGFQDFGVFETSYKQNEIRSVELRNEKRIVGISGFWGLRTSYAQAK
jgi:hypothetical protein